MRFGIRPGLRRLLALPRRSVAATRDDMDEELRFFLDARVEHLVSRGWSRADAEAEALRRLDTTNLETRARLHHSAEKRERRMRMRQWLDELVQDGRYAIRGLRGAKGFAAGVIVTLGLGIGANAAMFGVVDRLLLRPPALLLDPDNVHRVYLTRTLDGVDRTASNLQYRRYLDFRATTRLFDRSAVFFTTSRLIGTGQSAQSALISGVSASFFSFFEVRPVLGRFFTAAEDSIPAGTPVVVLGHGFWQSHFGGDADVLGKPIRIGETTFTIIGVAPPGWTGLERKAPDAFIPITVMGYESDKEEYFTTYSWSWIQMIVHRRAGVSLEAATTDLSTAYARSYASQREINRRLAPPETARPRAVLAGFLRERGPNQGNDSKVATWLIGVTLIVLLVACANVANLLLARAFGRKREVAIRLALGVSRGRLLRQLSIESLLLAVMGGALGLLLAQWGGSVLGALFLPDADWSGALFDGRSIWFTVVATLFAAVLAGMVPAVQSARPDVTDSLKAGPREGTYHRSRTRSVLMVAQASMSVVLLVGAGLFVRSLQNVRGLRLGFDPGRLVYVALEMRGTELSREQRNLLDRELRDRAASLPGVEEAALVVTVPFWRSIDFDIFVPGIDSAGKLGAFQLQASTPEYFRTAGTRILSGRGLEATDAVGSPLVMVVSEDMAKALWPGQNPLGKCVRLNADTMPCHTVVGVAENIVRESLNDGPRLQLYLSRDQLQRFESGLFVRTLGEAEGRAEMIRRELQRLTPGDTYVRSTPLTNIIDPMIRSWQLGATLFVAFGGLALAVATVGLYSLIAYNIAQRTHELGVRVALGATRGSVVGLVLGQGARVASAGVIIGIAIALYASRYVEPLLFKQSAKDPTVFATVAFALLVASMAACFVPARRATGVDPLTALRSD